MTVRRLSREERRLRFIKAAQQLFGEKGYRKTEVEELARLAGVTKPMLYRHFPGGKADLLMAVLDEHMNDLLRVLWEAMSASTEPRERLRRGIDAYLRFAEENPEGFHLLAGASMEMDASVGDRWREVRASIVRGLSTTIADVMRAAGLDDEGAPIYAYSLLGSAESVVSWWLETRMPPRDKLVGYLLAFAWRGFDGLPRDPTRFYRGGVERVMEPTEPAAKH